MRIRSADILFGLRALELRRLLQRVDAWDSFDVEMLREVAPMSRNAAKRLLADLGYRVTEVAVFGSYLGSDSTLGDVDAGVRLESRLSPDVDPVAHGAARVDLAKENGRVFRSWFDELTWSYKEVWLRLKSRSRGLSLHDLDRDGIFELDALELRLVYRDGRRDRRALDS